MDSGSDTDEEGEEGVEGPESADVYKDRWVRLAAEFDNYKKRTLRERDALIQSANERLIRELLPVVDSADRAAAHADGDDDSEAFKTGIRMIMEELPKILASRGLKEIEAKGQPFDPNLHEALMQVASDEKAGNVVVLVSPSRGFRKLEHVNNTPVNVFDGVLSKELIVGANIYTTTLATHVLWASWGKGPWGPMTLEIAFGTHGSPASPHFALYTAWVFI